MTTITPLEVPYPATLDYTRQGVEVPGTKRPGQTGHYRNGIWGLISLKDQSRVKSLSDIFNQGLALSRDQPYLGTRPQISQTPLKFADHYVWQTYAQVDERRRNLGSAVHRLFRDGLLGGGEMETVGIWSPNRPEWQIIDLALHAYDKVGVSLYDTLGKDSVEYIIDHSHLSVVFGSIQHMSTLLALAAKTPMLKMIVCIDPLNDEARRILTTWGAAVRVVVKDLNELEEMGKANRIDPIPSSPDRIASICYTSGTTNNPKGVVLTHGQLASSSLATLHGASFGSAGRLLSYLPLAHIYERMSELNVTATGGAIGYWTGDPLRLLEEAQILKPTFFPSVPRILNRVYQSAMLAGQVPGIKGFLFRSALEAKLKRLHETGDNTHAFWDRLVFKKIQAVLGGKLELLTCGSAPIGVDVMDFLKVAFSCEVVEGYGMTENCATCTRVLPNDPSSSGTVGSPQPCNEIKLMDVPHMGYTSEDKPNPRGELCVRGENCFNVYYKDEKNTKETIDSEGWMHTGDVAEVDSWGRFKIVDRIKNIMKLSQGEYVALEKIENVYGACPTIAQIYVHGDSLQHYLIGVVVPDPIQLSSVIQKVKGKTVRAEDLQGLDKECADPAVNEHILRQMTKEANKAGLKGFEHIKKIHLCNDPFTTDNNMLTPTLKIRRRDVYAKFKPVLDAMYASGENSKL